MKYVLAILLVLTSCKSVQRLTSKVDSTVVTEQKADVEWQREVIREFVPTFVKKDSLIVRYVERPVVVRETIRESGKATEQTKQEAEVKETVREVVKEVVPVWVYFMLVGVVLFCIFTLYMIAKMQK